MASEEAVPVVAKQHAQQRSVYTCLVMLAAVQVHDENEEL